MTKTTEQYMKAFEDLKEGRKQEPSWLLRLREEAMASFSRQGFPTVKDEAWRYTDVTSLVETALAVQDEAPSFSPEILAVLKEKPGRNALFTINGKFLPEHSSVPEGIEVMALTEAIAARPDWVASFLGDLLFPDAMLFRQ